MVLGAAQACGSPVDNLNRYHVQFEKVPATQEKEAKYQNNQKKSPKMKSYY